jgi:hypothetical protein
MKLDAKKLELNASTNGLVYALMGVGILSFIVGLLTNPNRTWYAYLLNHTLFMGFGIGAFFFLIIHYLAFAGWNVAVRRVTESFATYLPFAFAFNVILFFGLSHIYSWTNHEVMAHDHLLHGKIGYFALPFYIARTLVFFAAVVFFAMKMVGNSTRQDEEGGVDLLNRQKPLAAMGLVLFAPLFTVFSVDLLKSLDPKWFSTMFGVYVFIGFVQATAAAMIVAVRRLKKAGYLEAVTDDHFHDMGKYMFGFSIFWAYIAVSQYLLIWYANLPEETTFYLVRQTPGWVWISLLLPIVRFVLPFLLLLRRGVKRNSAYLEKVAILVIFGEWIDLNWMIMPAISHRAFSFSWLDIGMFLGFGGFFLFAVRRFLSKNNTVPTADPFLHETLHHHVM